MSKKAGIGIVEGAIFLQGWDQRAERSNGT